MVIPQTIVKVYRDIPWNKDYKHTYWFTAKTAQDNYFASKLRYSFTDFTYVRQTGVIRVPKKADDLFDCNYISFLNVGYGNKLFYAFITKIEYVNDETSYISFELDYIQTWLFELEVKQCFVEREHVADDTFGIHTVPEGLPIGSYIVNVDDTVTKLYPKTPSGWKLIIQAVPDDTVQGQSRGSMIGALYTGSEFFVKSGNDYNVTTISAFIDTLIQGREKIVAMYCVPDEWSDTAPETQIIGSGKGNNLNGYVPKNNKLFCYPYNFCEISSSDGDKVDILFEDEDQGHAGTFYLKTSILNGGQAILYPYAYKLDLNSFNKYCVTLSNPAQCIFSESSYLEYVHSDGIYNSIKGVANTFVTSTTVGGPLGGLVGLAKGLLMDMPWDLNTAEAKPDQVRVAEPKSVLAINKQQYGFRIDRISIKAEYARLIDDYFTRFGYKVMVNKIPELTSRQYFNYVKTVNATIGGNISQEAETKICEIFDSGITLWHTADIGNYSVNNAIVG